MKKNLVLQISIAFILAIIVGLLLGENASYIQPLGDAFLRLIKFIIVPLILSTIVVGVTSAGNIQKLGRLGGKTIGYYLFTTLIAISVGLLAGFILNPGSGLNISLEGASVEPSETAGIVSTLLNIIPTNPFEALTSGAILQIIFTAIFLGIGITVAGEKASPVKRFFEGFAEVMYKITGMVMVIVPIGVFGLLAPVIGTYGASVLMPLIKIIIAMAIASIVHMVLTYSFMVRALGKMNPIKFFKGIFPAAMVGFTTCSSAGTLPVTLKNSQENLGVSKSTSSFVLPLGATINMDGTAVYQGIAVMFIAQFYGIELTISQLLMVALIATLASIGTAGVPGAGLVMLTMVVTAINLPLEGIALVASIDRILDMFRTSVNVVGDASAGVVIDATEKVKEEDIDSDRKLASA